ncbi:hypothetical protein Tsp_02859 [Trichinella spiralis]|uniref:hypothetical protein n=1 Tax=Trichinella spiralis TaxID=6334 RepID=UPI0001EFC988|nr:hypothetical protein Tsp_02859 [Trichinella spiralis]
MLTVMCLLISCKIIFHIDLHCMPNRFMFYDGFYIDLSSRAVYCSILKLMFRLIRGKLFTCNFVIAVQRFRRSHHAKNSHLCSSDNNNNNNNREGRGVNDELLVCSGAAAFAYKRNVFYFYNACWDVKWILTVVTGSDELL